MSEILRDLNPEQLKAVQCLNGPMLIVAGAGSGKTRVLTSRIAYLIENGVPPERILALTFTKKAAGEMKDRIALMIGARKARGIWMGTFHSIFIRFLREWADWLGFPHEFTIYDTQDSQGAIKNVIKQLGLDDKVYKPREVLSRISWAKNALITPKPYAAGEGGLKENDTLHKKPEIYRIYSEYCKACRKSGVMDFDDILLYTYILLRGNPEAAASISSRFEHILVDEYQDTNMAQYKILQSLAAGHHNLCVVGDDSQSIYGFRGAEIQNILSFSHDFPEAKVFRLERNYRSTQTIVNAANTVIARNEGRIPKNCVSMGENGEKLHLVRSYTEQEEAMQVASSILSRMRKDQAQYQDFAILYRTNAQSRALEEQLRRRNIPYMIYSGNSFFERAEVKDLMAYFKLAVNNRDDEAFRRIVNKPARGIGDTSVATLAEAARVNGLSLFEAAYLPNLETFGLRAAATAKIKAFCDMIASAGAEDGDAVDVAMTLSRESGLFLFYKSDTSIEGQSRFANIQELLDSVASYKEEEQGSFVNTLIEDGAVQDASEVPADSLPKITLGAYLENVSLLSNVDVADDEMANRVALMTVHSAKGLEFPYVYITGLEENLFPAGGWMASPKDLEEERRLFYVALTRAEKAVELSFATTRMRNGKHESNSPSRFLKEIAPQYLDAPLTSGSFSSFSSHFDDVRPVQKPAFSQRPAFTPRPAQPKPEPKPSFTASRPLKSASEISRPPVIDENFVPDPMSSFKVGDRVEHNRFGAGEVLEITGKIPELKARIRFDQFGEKLLLLKFAKLRHV